MTCLMISIGQGTAHQAGPEARKVKLAEVGTIQLGDEHRRDAVQGRAMLRLDRSEGCPGVEDGSGTTMVAPWVTHRRVL